MEFDCDSDDLIYIKKLTPETKLLMKRHNRIHLDLFEDDYNLINYSDYPNWIQISFGCGFNHDFDLSYNINLVFANFNDAKKFNKPIDGRLPEQLKILYLGTGFNQPVDNLPNTLEILHLSGKEYEHNLNMLPDSILELWILTPVIKQDIFKLPAKLITFASNKRTRERFEKVLQNETKRVFYG